MDLNHIFGSKTRAKLLNLFLKNAGRSFYVRELTRKINEEINSVRRELENLEGLGLITPSKKKNRKYYIVDKTFYLFPQLRDLILKIETPPENKITNHIKQLGKLQFVALTGRFIENSNSPIDVLLVGKIDEKKQLKGLLKRFEGELGQEVNYALMDAAEFETRQSVRDKFLQSCFTDDAIVIYDTLKSKKVAKKIIKNIPKAHPKRITKSTKNSEEITAKPPTKQKNKDANVYIEKQI